MNLQKTICNHLDFSILIVASVFFIPFFGTSLSIDPVLMPQFLMWSVATFVLLVSFAIQLLMNSNRLDCSILRRVIFPLFLGYFLFSLISLTGAVNVTEGIFEVLKIFVSFVYLFIATIILNKNRNYCSILVKMVLITAAILSLIAVCQYFLYAFCEPGVNVLYSITSKMAHKNLLSSALFLTLPFCLYALFNVLWFLEVYKYCPGDIDTGEHSPSSNPFGLARSFSVNGCDNNCSWHFRQKTRYFEKSIS